MVLDASKTIFSLLKLVTCCEFYLELVLDASKTIFLIGKIGQIVQVYLGMVLDASKTIFHCLISKILGILSSIGFGRIQYHFFIAKISQIVQVDVGMVLEVPQTIFFIAKVNQLHAFYLELVLDAS